MPGINHEAVKAHGEKGLHTEWNADHKQTGNHDCEQFQHLNHVIENRAAFPGGPVVGQVVYRTDYNNFFGWNGTLWQSLTPVATIVVAADGTGNYLTIQEGVDALPAGGGVVYIKEGTYVLTARIIINKDNVSIKGAGRSTIITNSLNTINIIKVNAGIDYFTIDDVYFNPAVELGGAGAVLLFDGATITARISGCWFNNWEAYGVAFVAGAAGIILENCVFLPVASVGPNYAILINSSSYNYIRGNYIAGGTNVYAIQLITAASEHNSILDNKIYNTAAAISVIGNGGVVGKLNIIGNFLAGFTYGIWLNTSSENIISANKIELGTIGILLENNSDNNNMGNNIIGGCNWGIIINAATEDKNIVVANGLIGNGVALLDNGTNSEIGHNTT